MRAAFGAALSLGTCLLLASSCGKPRRFPTPPELMEVTDFHTLFNRNCVGCHGPNGMKGPGPRLNDPVYLAVIDRNDLAETIRDGRPGTPMPAFGGTKGSLLSERQIQAIVNGMEREWSRKVDFHGASVPVYSVQKAAPGDAARGQMAYMKDCMMCHGFGSFKGAAGPILDPQFLALISDQGLRTTMIVGRVDWGMPDWRNRIPGHPMKDQDMSDIVAWLASKRPQYARLAMQPSILAAPHAPSSPVSTSTGASDGNQKR